MTCKSIYIHIYTGSNSTKECQPVAFHLQEGGNGASSQDS